MEEIVLENLSWVMSGTQRVKIVIALDKPKTPKILQKETNLNFSNVSTCLKDLVNKDLAICLNPQSHLGKLYKLTELGEKIRGELKKY